MSLAARIARLERALRDQGYDAARCGDCGAPERTAACSVMLRPGEELGACERCDWPMWEGKPVGQVVSVPGGGAEIVLRVIEMPE